MSVSWNAAFTDRVSLKGKAIGITVRPFVFDCLLNHLTFEQEFLYVYGS